MTIPTVWLPGEWPISRNGMRLAGLPKRYWELEPYGHDRFGYPEMWAARWLRVRLEREGLPHVTLKIRKVGQRYRCVELDGLTDPTNPEGFVDANSLRKLQLPALVREAVELVTYTMVELFDEEILDWAKETLEGFGGDGDPAVEIDIDALTIGDYFRFPLYFGAISEPDEYERRVRPIVHNVYGRQHVRGPAVSDEEFIKAWEDAWARDESIQDTLAEKFHMVPGAVRNRAGRLRAKGHTLNTRRGRNAT
jgi:hypothetical protein